MEKIERLTKAFNLEQPDRPPIVGGWLAAPEHILALTGCTDEQYWDDLFHWGLASERKSGQHARKKEHSPLFIRPRGVIRH